VVEIQKKNAVLSVSDKEGLDKIGNFLLSQGFDLYCTSGTKRFLESKGIRCESVEKLTGNPEILQGRVKTLSSSLMAGILAVERDDPDLRKFGYMPIDLVYVEPYDFVSNYLGGSTDLAEFIDIGGITMIRAAAKNFQRVITVPSKSSMEDVMREMRDGEVSLELRRSLARVAFEIISMNDYAISQWLDGSGGIFMIGGKEYVKLRYGENPHQSAHSYALYPPFFNVLKVGKEVSFNNIIDAWAAWELVLRLGQGSSAVVKHASPCGAAISGNSVERAYESDPTSAYGGILAFNGILTSVHADILKDKFLEVIIAREYEGKAFEDLGKKRNLRLLEGRQDIYTVPDVRTAGNVLLVQDWNKKSALKIEVKSGESASANLEDVRFGWEVVKSIKSNAIAIVRDGWLLSSGGGQPNRVDSVKIAVGKAKEMGRLDESAILISDGFFPFTDSVEYIKNNGLKTIAAPMGSIRDKDVLDYSSRNGLTFIEIKERGFRH
jgi:phosphoribosylaminoimidazolecarboxamide formyltransferase/IMP cyclohydrolase